MDMSCNDRSHPIASVAEMNLPGRGGKTTMSGTRSWTITIVIAVIQVENRKYNMATSVFQGSELTMSRPPFRRLFDLAILVTAYLVVEAEMRFI